MNINIASLLYSTLFTVNCLQKITKRYKNKIRQIFKKRYAKF